MNIQDYYCVATQEQANEAKELLIKAGEEIMDDEMAFIVDDHHCAIQHRVDQWYVFDCYVEDRTLTTYPEFKQMLLTKIEGDGK